MPNFISNYFNKKFIDPKVTPLKSKIKQQEDLIKIQQDRFGISKTDSPQFFSGSPFFLGDGTKDVVIRKGVDFTTLRSFAEIYDVARACINRRKRQIERVDWSVVPVDGNKNRGDYQKDINLVEDFFSEPSGKYSTFREFVAKLTEELLTIDAGVVWKDYEGFSLKKLVVVDGATIKRRVYSDGSLPEAPDIAFEQWIQGSKAGQWTTEEMFYAVLNPRSTTPYGLAPLESLILGVDAAVKAQLYNTNILTEGNIPEGFYSLPENYTPKEIADFQQWFDSVISGNPAQHKIKFMPGGTGTGYNAPVKPKDMRFIEYEKWLLMKTCAIFDVPPSEIGFTEDVNKATSQVQEEIGAKAGLLPILFTLKDIFDVIIQEDMGLPHLQWHWYALDKKDELRDAQVADTMIRLGAISVDEWRQENSLEPIGVDNFILTASGPMFLEDVLKDRGLPKNEIKVFKEKKDELVDLAKWERKATNNLKDGVPFKKFKSSNIDEGTRKIIETQLEFVTDKEQLKNVFGSHIAELKQNEILQKALALKEEIGQTLDSI